MSDKRRQPTVSGAFPAVTDRSGLQASDDSGVFVIVTRAYDGNGNNMIHSDGPAFDGFPGVTVFVELPDGRHGSVTLSPIHGDSRKECDLEIEQGTSCTLFAKNGAEPLQTDGECKCGGTYHRIYFGEDGTRGGMALICDTWGCHRSRIIDETDLLSWIDY